MGIPFAYTFDQVIQVTGVPGSLIRRWDTTNVVAPSIARLSRRVPYGRVYTFRDLVALRAIADLRERFDLSHRQVQQIGQWLARHSDTPWSEVRFFVVGQDVVFEHPDPTTGTTPGQPAPIIFDLASVAAALEPAARALMERRPEEIGRITRHPYILHNKPVLAGTRVPTSAVYSFHRAGHGLDRILEAYPDLTAEDVAAAIVFEQGRQARAPRTAA